MNDALRNAVARSIVECSQGWKPGYVPPLGLADAVMRVIMEQQIRWWYGAGQSNLRQFWRDHGMKP